MKMSVAPDCATSRPSRLHGCFENADGRRANGKDPLRTIDRLRRLGCDRETFGMHPMLRDGIALHRSKCAGANVQGNESVR